MKQSDGQIAYLMRFAVNPLERLLMKLLRKKEPKRWIRVTAAAVSLLVLLGAAVGLLCGIVPSIYYNIVDLLSVLPEYLESIGTWIDELLAHSNVELSQSAAEMLRDGLSKLGNGIVENLSEYVAVAGNVIISVGVSVFNVLIGILVAFYVLMDSPRYARLGNRALRALISDERRYQSAKAFIAETDTVMGKYINGKLIETFAVGVICFLGFLILGAVRSADERDRGADESGSICRPRAGSRSRGSSFAVGKPAARDMDHRVFGFASGAG